MRDIHDLWSIAGIVLIVSGLVLGVLVLLRLSKALRRRAWFVALGVLMLAAVAIMTVLRTQSDLTSGEHTAPSTSPEDEHAVPNPADIGVTPPTLLGHYRHWAGAPAFCADPHALLARIGTAVRHTNGCSAQVTTGIFGAGQQLNMRCIAHSSDRCTAHYISIIWPLRDEASTADYGLYGFGTGQRSCGVGGTMFDSPEVRSSSRGTSTLIASILSQCRVR